jgi:hypothetical protein
LERGVGTKNALRQCSSTPGHQIPIPTLAGLRPPYNLHTMIDETSEHNNGGKKYTNTNTGDTSALLSSFTMVHVPIVLLEGARCAISFPCLAAINLLLPSAPASALCDASSHPPTTFRTRLPLARHLIMECARAVIIGFCCCCSCCCSVSLACCSPPPPPRLCNLQPRTSASRASPSCHASLPLSLSLSPFPDGAAIRVGLTFKTNRIGPLGYLAMHELAAEDPRNTTGNYGANRDSKSPRWLAGTVLPLRD